MFLDKLVFFEFFPLKFFFWAADNNFILNFLTGFFFPWMHMHVNNQGTSSTGGFLFLVKTISLIQKTFSFYHFLESSWIKIGKLFHISIFAPMILDLRCLTCMWACFLKYLLLNVSIRVCKWSYVASYLYLF